MLLVLEDDMEILRWPDQALLATAPLDWEILMLYRCAALCPPVACCLLHGDASPLHAQQ